METQDTNPPHKGRDKGKLKQKDFTNDIEQLNKKANEARDKQTNRFPVEAFPEPVQQIIKATNESQNFPIDFTGASILFAGSVAIGNTHRVEVQTDWLESAVLYIALVGRPGTNKTHPLNWAVKPIREHDTRTHSQYEQLRKEYEKAVRLLKRNREQQAIDEPEKPIWQKFLVSDFTQEALAERHKFNKRGIGVKIDELAGWVKNFNQYKSKGSEMEFWLSQFSGEAINIDRKTSEPIFIPVPFISVCGTIQNGVLQELAKEGRTQNGFMDRILFVIPDVIKPYLSETDLSPVIYQNWKSIISKLLSLSVTYDETMNPSPEVLRFTPEAESIFRVWHTENTDRCNNTENEALRGIYSKFDMYAVRLALILEMMRYACNESDKQAVSVEAIQGAIKLVEYFRNSAEKVNSILSKNASPLDKLPADRRNLYEALPDTFTTETGLQIAESENFKVSERTFKYFLTNRELFNRIKQGEYEKRI